MQHQKYARLLTLSTVVGLVACGGGGGGEEAIPLTATPLSVLNYADTVEVAVVSIGGSESLRSLLPQAQSATQVNQWSDLASGDPGTISRWMVRQVTQEANAKAKPAAVQQETELCAGGGSLVVTLNDADNNEVLSGGDTLTLNAVNCVAVRGQSPVNGQLALRVNSVQLTNDDTLSTAAFNLTFTNFNSAGVSLNGSVDFSLDNLALRLQYRGVTARYQDVSLTFDFTRTESLANSSVVANGNLVINGSSYLLSTPSSLLPGSRYFSAGTLRVADRSGGYADVVMADTGYRANLYLPGDSVVDATKFVLWSAL